MQQNNPLVWRRSEWAVRSLINISERTARSVSAPYKTCVVLLHGISKATRSFRKMQAALEASGFATLNLDYASRRNPLEMLAGHIHSAIAGFATGVDVLSISSVIPWVDSWRGSAVHRYRPQRLGRVVVLGRPNGGSEIADRLKNFSAYRAFFGPAGRPLRHGAGRRRSITNGTHGDHPSASLPEIKRSIR